MSGDLSILDKLRLLMQQKLSAGSRTAVGPTKSRAATQPERRGTKKTAAFPTSPRELPPPPPKPRRSTGSGNDPSARRTSVPSGCISILMHCSTADKDFTMTFRRNRWNHYSFVGAEKIEAGDGKPSEFEKYDLRQLDFGASACPHCATVIRSKGVIQCGCSQIMCPGGFDSARRWLTCPGSCGLSGPVGQAEIHAPGVQGGTRKQIANSSPVRLLRGRL